MGEQAQPERLAVDTAEEILRTIYGDDLKGCNVTLDQVAGPIQRALSHNAAELRELLEVYEKVVEAIHLLSVPPENASALDANALRSLLGERLDMVNSVAKRTIDTTAKIKGQRGPAS